MLPSSDVFGQDKKVHTNNMKTTKQQVLDGTSKWSAKLAITGRTRDLSFLCSLFLVCMLCPDAHAAPHENTMTYTSASFLPSSYNPVLCSLLNLLS